MDFDELKTELLARGFDYLDDTRAGRFINFARAELDRMYLWPYREASATGTAPLAITDLGTVEAVIDTSNLNVPLSFVDYRSLLDFYGDLSIAGSPAFYYVAWPSGTPTVATYPTSSNTIGVQYWRVTPDLVNASDTPLAPSNFHGVYLDIAVRMAYRDSDNHEAAVSVQAEVESKVSEMLVALPPGIPDGPDAFVGVTGASSDW